jgi:hypothetical protein
VQVACTRIRVEREAITGACNFSESRLSSNLGRHRLKFFGPGLRTSGSNLVACPGTPEWGPEHYG